MEQIVMTVLPYYQDDLITLYHGDCRDILPEIEHGDTCIVDPVWPNSVFPKVKDPAALFAEMCGLLHVERLVVQLGCMSDPRFLAGVPASLPFLRTCWLAYAHPSYVGRILMGSDVAYAYGVAPSSRPGRKVLPGQCMAKKNNQKLWHSGRGNGSSDTVKYDELPHPSPRRYEHVAWLVSVFAEASVIDPFIGTGTSLLAAKNAGLKAIGIEIEEAYCEIAAGRMGQEVFAFES
ncbi:MAG TPA: hypothetical protein DCP24_13120 [Nitrospiraceae bacterium]|nr:hypothetical protein [Nitrospiraceae bacterium]